MDKTSPELVKIVQQGLPKNNSPSKNIIILGAGISGLVAASELLAAGHNVTIIGQAKEWAGEYGHFVNHLARANIRKPER